MNVPWVRQLQPLAPPLCGNEDVRLRTLNDTGILDTPPDPAFDRLTRLAATIFNVPIAYVSFVDRSRQWLKSNHGFSVTETPRNGSFCAHTILDEQVTVVLDARLDPRFSTSPLVCGPPHVRFYAGAPLTTSDGLNLGSFCIVDTEPRSEFTCAQAEVLRTLADLAREATEAHQRTLALQETAAEARGRYALVSRATLDGVWDWDIKTNTVYYSPRWQYLMGYPEGEYTADLSYWMEHIHPEDRTGVEEELDRHLNGISCRFRSEHRVRHCDGSWRWVMVRGLAESSASGARSRMAGSLMDVTTDKTSDPLTGLVNRIFLRDQISRLIHRCEAAGNWNFAVLFLDVDRFKRINDRFGHLIGDIILCCIANRLKEGVSRIHPRAESMVARFAGDEFVILLDDVRDGQEAKLVADRLAFALNAPITCEGEQITPGVSIGVAIARPDHRTPEDYLHNADLAMYRAKATGRGSAVLFDPNMQKETMERLELEAALRLAIDGEQLRVQYQPQIGLSTGKLIGCEALVRWQHPKLGLLAPAAFIDLAEEMNIISAIDRWVMENACRQLAEWRQTPLGADLTVSVNISGQHLCAGGLTDVVTDLLRRHNLPSGALILELTESVLMEDVPGSIRLMQELRSVGVGLHMDDFGSGYSSFKHLYELPFDTLKIDRSFMKKLLEDPQAKNIVEGIIGLAHTMNLSVIAEGIETPEQAHTLSAMGCDSGQGYFFDRPITPALFHQRHLDPFRRRLNRLPAPSSPIDPLPGSSVRPSLVGTPIPADQSLQPPPVHPQLRQLAC